MAKITPSSLAKCFKAGNVKCRICGRVIKSPGLEPLTTTKCPKCQQEILVPKQVANYFLYQLQGNGGMGSVFKAINLEEKDSTPVALKLMSRSAMEDPANIAALVNEAHVASLFNGCEFIAGCLDHGYEGGEYYTISTCIEGERLDKLVQRRGRLSEPDMIRLALHILAAEQHIYRNGYLFRDLKPENVVINNYGYAILLDFGLCIPLTSAANPSDIAVVPGSPYYIPPERLLAEPENAASEIYSLGMVMYYGLTGNNYFNASEIDALAKRHVSDLRISNTGKLNGISPKLAQIIDLMIRQNNAERPQDFLEVANVLKNLLKELQ